MRETQAKPELHQRIFVPLDLPDAERAVALARSLAGRVGGFKIGLELFCASGPALVARLGEHGAIFLDLKLHDIPNTVAGAAACIGRLGVRYFTLHATGGAAMMRAGADAARDAALAAGLPLPTALAVTVLTSHDDATLRAIGMPDPCAQAVARLADLAREAGAGGLVCSPREIGVARRRFPAAVLAVPGIRPPGADVAGDDQARTSTPEVALRSGADLLIVGRPITRAADPVRAVEALVAGILDAAGN